ncbi:MAG TPA: hypothetical protein VGN95_05485, partial [Pyrinomonadaceae bacterium]|nr:hypothetical protein [Pyrinomonadaceae bacterium]
LKEGLKRGKPRLNFLDFLRKAGEEKQEPGRKAEARSQESESRMKRRKTTLSEREFGIRDGLVSAPSGAEY